MGKNVRLSKIINPHTKRTCIVPLDHGVTLGPIDGLKCMAQTIGDIVDGGADAVILHKGMLLALSEYHELLYKGNFILHLSASTNISLDISEKRLVSSVERALKMGAIGVSFHINMGVDTEPQMIADMGRISDACMDWGMPLLAMIYVNVNGVDSYDGRAIAHAARVAEELGADLVKVACPKDIEDLSMITNSVNIPVIISGGAKISTEILLKKVYEALKMGVRGISIGRNIFQTGNPKIITKIMSEMVHNKVTLEEALNKLQ